MVAAPPMPPPTTATIGDDAKGAGHSGVLLGTSPEPAQRRHGMDTSVRRLPLPKTLPSPAHAAQATWLAGGDTATATARDCRMVVASTASAGLPEGRGEE